MGLTLDALRPRSNAGRERRSGGEKRRSSAQGGYRQGELLRGERLSYGFIADQRMREDAACPRVRSVQVGRKAARRERPAYVSVADRRMVRKTQLAQGA